MSGAAVVVAGVAYASSTYGRITEGTAGEDRSSRPPLPARRVRAGLGNGESASFSTATRRIWAVEEAVWKRLLLGGVTLLVVAAGIGAAYV